MRSRRYLALYDYGSGGVWMHVLGDSRGQIVGLFPELELHDAPPEWMNEDDIARIKREMTFDVRRPTGWLAELQEMRSKRLAERSRDLVPLVETRRSVAHSEIPLTTRELEVLAEIASGLSNKEIAERLKISPKTVTAHVRSLLKKMQVSREALTGA